MAHARATMILGTIAGIVGIVALKFLR